MVYRNRDLWTREALCEALADLGEPDDIYQPDGPNESARQHILQWKCGHIGLINATEKATNAYNLVVGCTHRHHLALALVAIANASDVSLTDREGTLIYNLAPDLEGAYLRFKLSTDVPLHVRVEAMLDPAEQGIFRACEEYHDDVTAGILRLSFALRVDPTGPNGRMPLPRQDVALSIHVLDSQTAERDRGADGICLWDDIVPITPSTSRQ